MVLILLVWVLAAVVLAFGLGAAVRIADRRDDRELYVDDVLAVTPRVTSRPAGVPADR